MYSEHYGLTGNPFQLTPDPRFYFESETHRKAMAYLGYGLAQGEGFIVITGDIGAGKTTLVSHLMATIDTTRLTAVQVVSTQVDGDDMLRLAAQQFGLNVEGAVKAQLLDRIERYLHEQSRQGKRTLLIVDEAQNLAVSALEELRMLSNFQSGGRALLQIFLLGQPEFRDRVKSSPHLEQLRQRIIATHHLEPMQANEIEDYVAHRMTIAGWQGNPSFASDAFAALYKASDGVPRKLNTFMARVLLYGAVEDLTVIDGNAVAAVLNDLAGERIDHQPLVSAEAETPVADAEADTDEIAVEDPVVEQPHAYASLVGGHQFNAPPEDDIIPEVHAEPEAAPHFAADAMPQSHDDAEREAQQEARIAALEARVEEQDAALRRVLTLLVNWVEEEEARPNLGVVKGSAA